MITRLVLHNWENELPSHFSPRWLTCRRIWAIGICFQFNLRWLWGSFMIWLWFVSTGLNSFILLCGSVGRWSLLEGIWVMGVESHKWINAFLAWVISCSYGTVLVIARAGCYQARLSLMFCLFHMLLLSLLLSIRNWSLSPSPEAKQVAMPCLWILRLLNHNPN
jgi:hypothetical protein